MIGRGIATRIALAALVSAGVGLAILGIGVAVVGADVFRQLMVEAGDLADHAQAMYDQSVMTVIVAAAVVAAIASIVLAFILARMLARPLAEVGSAARRIAEGDYAARVPRDGPGTSLPASPIRSTRWRPVLGNRRRCGAISSPMQRTSCARR